MFKEYITEAYQKSVKDRNYDKAPQMVKTYMMFELARNLYTYGEAYQFLLDDDKTFQEACKTIYNTKLFKKYKIAER